MDNKKLVYALKRVVKTCNALIKEAEKQTVVVRVSEKVVTDIVEDYFGVKTDVKSRKREIVKARDILCVCLRRYTDLTLDEMAVKNNSGDHSTTIKQVSRGYQYKEELKHIFKLIENSIL